MNDLIVKQLFYVFSVFILSVFIFILVAFCLGGAQDPVVAYFLSLIASNFIVKEVKDIK